MIDTSAKAFAKIFREHYNDLYEIFSNNNQMMPKACQVTSLKSNFGLYRGLLVYLSSYTSVSQEDSYGESDQNIDLNSDADERNYENMVKNIKQINNFMSGSVMHTLATDPNNKEARADAMRFVKAHADNII